MYNNDRKGGIALIQWTKTVKARIIGLVLVFAFAVSGLVITFSYYIVSQYQFRINVQSTSANLELIAATVERDLVEAVALANWCSIGANPPAVYLSSQYDPVRAVHSFERLQEEYRNNRAYNYISRLIVISNSDSSRLLHTGSNSVNTTLSYLDQEKESALARYELHNTLHIYDIAPDPYARNDTKVINILAPVRAPQNKRTIGTVYLALSTQVITDSLKGYNFGEGAALYLTVDTQTYRIEGNQFVPVETLCITQTADGEIVTDDANNTLDVISRDIRPGLTLIHVASERKMLPTTGNWFPLMVGVLGLILLLSFFVILTMSRAISRPVALIRRKMQQIAAGDFSRDPSIETDSEIGEVGRGINQLSCDVVQLMDTRLAAEQQKQELEYRMLQSQINPHFLYNSLGAIKWMATLQKADGIAEMTTSLSRLLKTVSKDQRKVVPLQEEIALLDDYYMILKYRYGGTVTFEKQIEDKSLLQCRLPRFVLQPLMENAIFHGIEPKGRGKITLHVAKKEEDVFVCIQDDGIGIAPEVLATLDWNASEQPEGSAVSVGMRSVHQRVRSVFGAAYGLQIESRVGEYTKSILHLPFAPFEKTNPKGVLDV